LLTKTVESIDFTKFKYCECRCWELITILNNRGRLKRFKQYHGNRGENNGMYKKIGNDHPRWKGGIFIDNRGYILIRNSNRQNSHKNGFIYQHRLIYENYLSILFDEEVFIPQEYEIHHINEIKSDNRLINLELLTKQEHRTKHEKIMSNRICLLCKSDKTYITQKGKPHWLKYHHGYICMKCYIQKRN